MCRYIQNGNNTLINQLRKYLGRHTFILVVLKTVSTSVRKIPVPPEAEHSVDESDRDGLAEEGGEHEEHGGEELRGSADLSIPAAVEGRSRRNDEH